MATPGRITATPLDAGKSDTTATELAEARELLAAADRSLGELLDLISSRRVDLDVLTRAERTRLRLGRFVVTP